MKVESAHVPPVAARKAAATVLAMAGALAHTRETA
jgi:hypothetical protein